MARKLSAAKLAAVAAAVDAPAIPGGEPLGAAPPAVEYLPVAGLVRHPRNARAIPPSAADTAALVASVRAIGVLMPVLVAPLDDGGLGVLAGWQRVNAAIAAGRTTVPAIRVAQEDAALDRLSLVENAMRTAMHPVDTWRSVDTLMQGGATLDAAAAALGLSDREARQMRLLSQLHPAVLDAMVGGEMPGTWILREIVRVSPERQAEVLKAATIKRGKETSVDWRTLSGMCRVTRIPRAFAVFDHAKAGVVFERDFFVEPGAQDEWTTTDVDGFRAAQAAALAQLVDGNERAAVHEWKPGGYGPTVPAGWMQIRWMDKVPKALPDLADRDRFVVTIKDDGQAQAYLYRAPEDAPVQEAGGSGTTASKPPVRMLTDAGLQMAATMKHEALRECLAEFRKTVPVHDDRPLILLRVVLECLGAMNVTPGGADKHAAAEAIAEATPEGGEPSPSLLIDLACKTIGDMLIFPAPKLQSSGPVADAIAASLGAEAYLPRFDTADFLAQCSGTLLREAARLVERQPGQKVPNGVGELRAFLVGKLPDWRPVGFGQETEEAPGEG